MRFGYVNLRCFSLQRTTLRTILNEKAPRTRSECVMSALSCFVVLFLSDFVYLDGVLCLTALVVTWYDAYIALQR